ncbi:hypothetical protein LU290_03070 [Moraxella nasibovis]|uniref:hypothetical protein n=1 Tax=Moraxella nasibovis TaxID=2904120 RepID=UPI00240FEEA3|nr:hypothetical protein [Moraxella nasibovis]WFF39219.1 hypothetical protein LU290_03070 [Moraxella nasibovis]
MFDMIKMMIKRQKGVHGTPLGLFLFDPALWLLSLAFGVACRGEKFFAPTVCR